MMIPGKAITAGLPNAPALRGETGHGVCGVVKSMSLLTTWLALFVATLVWPSANPAAAGTDVERIMQASCSGCHSAEGTGLSRVSEQRKTPEGWQMTLTRMQLVHKARIFDPAAEGEDENTATRKLVKYLADTQGLAPSESQPFRYILEQELNTIEQHATAQFGEMCARCHSGARVRLQRRSEVEWRHLVHFHLGQFPTTEYSLMGRDRNWLDQALDQMVPVLSAEYPLHTAQWRQWQEAGRPGFRGRWHLLGSMPGKGSFHGTMEATGGDGDQYALTFSGSFEDGEQLSGSGRAVVYTGYEWRATLKLGATGYRQVLAASEDGGGMQGRMFQTDHSERGMRVRAVRDTGEAILLAAYPAYLRAGEEAVLELAGAHLAGDPRLGEGIEVLEVLQRDDHLYRLRVAIAAGARTGSRTVKIGDSALDNGFTVFRRIDRVEVEPGFAVARVGGGGGSQPVVEALFDAVAWSDGVDGKPDTDDDFRIGRVDANWSVAPFDAIAARDGDQRFAGLMDKDSGIFTPARAGPNPQRKYQTNNVGNLKVSASLKQDGKPLTGEAQLMVTVQRWNNPPIR
jgi:quinohemoprotein amine dehydrogenase